MDAAIRAISDPRRRRMLRLVRDEERSAGDIHRALGEVTFGAVSQGLRVLRSAGLVDVRVFGRHRYYRARLEGLTSLMRWLDQMWAESLDDLRALAEAEASGDETNTP